LEEMVRMAREQDILIIFQNYPRADNFYMRDVAERYDVPFIDNLIEFNKKENFTIDPNEYFLNGKACSLSGNDVITDNIYRKLKQLGVSR
ncbi:MAG: hypothetical protein ACOCWO_03250, partial [Candidatus Muiribacteriaceae bacterium]